MIKQEEMKKKIFYTAKVGTPLQLVLVDNFEAQKQLVEVIDLAVAEREKEIVEMCQKEMYQALEEVCQYTIDKQKMFVNKSDIKVWIKALSLITKNK